MSFFEWSHPRVFVEGRLEYGYDLPCDIKPPLPPDLPLGKASMPVARELSPAGKVQMFGGTDLGIQNARVNVGIYNAARTGAAATVRVVRAACAAEAVTSTAIAVPPDTLLQTRVGIPAICAGADRAAPNATVLYVALTVDQPSLSYVAVISNDVTASATFTIPNPM
jgi:hypothetical protein